MISMKMPRDDFKREHPNAEATYEGFPAGTNDQSMLNWLGADFVRIADYYRIESEPVTVILLSNGESGFEDKLVALPPGVTIVKRRKGMRSKVMLYKLTALEVLESTEIKCKWIPVFPVYGDEIDLDGQVLRSGVVRHARDPQAMYNFWLTSATEEVAIRGKVPYIGAEGQFEGYEDDWEAANLKAFPYLEYKPVSLDGQLAPPPQRQPMIDVPQGVLTMAMHANDNIKATTGLFDSSIGAGGNARSGLQERQQQRQGNIANFHYTDNLNRTIRHAARCLISMIPAYYDTARVVRIMGVDGQVKSEKINQPIPPEQQKPDPKTGAIASVLNDVTVGEYDVVVAAGPSYSTLRQEAVANMVDLGGKWPKLMDVAGDKVVRAMDWPGAEEIADRIEKTIPAELRDKPEGEDQAPVVNTPRGPIPVDQAAQMLQEMDQQMQQMGQQLQEASAGITKAKLDNSAMVEKARIDAESREKVAEINSVAKADVAELTGMVQLLIARVPPPPVLAEDVAGDLAKDEPAPPPAVAATPRRKRISIQAPSGQVYRGTIHDEDVPPDEGAPAAAPAAPAPEAPMAPPTQ